MLLFSTFDFEESRDASQEDEDADYPWPIRRFVTTVAEAAARLDDLGIDLHTCRVWFEQFKEQDFMYFNHLKKRPYDDPEYVPLTLEMYEQHLILQRQFFVRTAFTAICGDNRATFVLPNRPLMRMCRCSTKRGGYCRTADGQ